MNLTERLQEAAERRQNEVPPLTTIELGRRREPVAPTEAAPVEAAQLPALAPAGPPAAPRPAEPTRDEAPRTEPVRSEIDLRAAQVQPAARPVTEPPLDGESRRSGAVARFTALREKRVAAVADPRPASARHLDEVPAEARTCPRCGEPARLDINDRTRGVLHLSCDSCFKMWQVAVTPSGTP